MMTPEQRLWREVILFAIRDALRQNPRGMDSRSDMDEARSFFESHGKWRKWFDTCCHLAGWEPEFVRDGYRNARSRGARGLFGERA